MTSPTRPVSSDRYLMCKSISKPQSPIFGIDQQPSPWPPEATEFPAADMENFDRYKRDSTEGEVSQFGILDDSQLFFL